MQKGKVKKAVHVAGGQKDGRWDQDHVQVAPPHVQTHRRGGGGLMDVVTMVTGEAFIPE